jgi:steroid 5-alpha reductase family enzyme
MPAIAEITLVNLALLAACFAALWALSVAIKDASIVDIFWGPACALPAILTFLRGEGAQPRATILAALVTLWAARLALHLAARNLGRGEDFRYRAMRARHASDAAFARWSLVCVFALQCAIAWFVSLPVQIGQIGGEGSPGSLAFIGIAVFALGFGFEAVGDWQLARFKRNAANRGRLMTEGLWSLTRHPNYFGDAAVWTGLTLIALEAPYGWATILSPILMTHFLVNISGKAMLERSLEKKYPEYAAYRQSTSGFLPMPRRR